jgi:hypothetical protein
MAKRGRQPGFVMSDEHRVKIQNSNILNALIEHAEGRREMSPSQVSSGLGLLKKVLPDLAAVEIAGDPTKPVKLVIEWAGSGE